VTLANIAGNYVVVRIAPHQFATYAHLQRGSIRVQLRQHLGRGDVLGLLGNSGHSTGPHLHLQVTDGPSVLGSEGVPYVFTSYSFLGLAKDFEENKHPVSPRHREIPVEDAVSRLP
jgi:murein DD-endopeptidase MepM/ murein hydrolase activator NlpD